MNIRLIKKLDLYILKKFLGTFFFLILIIVVIAIVFDFSEKIDDFVEHNASAHAIIFEYYLNFAPYFALLFSPMFTFIAVIFFTSKMAYQTEIIAILSSGISFLRFLYPYFLGALILGILTFTLNNFVLPHANKVRLKFEDRYLVTSVNKPPQNTVEERNIHKQIQPGVFIYLESYSSLSNVGYKFTIEKFEEGKLKEKLSSDYITWDSTKRKWTMNNYYIRKITGIQESLSKGNALDTVIGLTPEDFVRRDNAVETMNYYELNYFIKQQKLHGEESINAYILEKNKRIAGPFSTFILTLIGVALSSRKVRGGIGMHIGLGLGICFGFILFNQFSSQFAISGAISPAFAVWIPNIIFFAIGVVLYRLAPK